MLNHRDFQDFLMHKCLAQNPHVLDDDSVDFFDQWVQELEADDWIKYGNEYKEAL